MASNDAPIHDLKLEIPKLHSLPSEQQDLYLLTFTSELARHVANLDHEGATAMQNHVKTEVFQVLNLSSPVPSRVIRNNAGQCLAGVLSKGDRKILFETVNDLLAIINNAGKSEKEAKSKHAAVHCIGMVFEAAGDSAISLSSNVGSSVLKSMKNAQNFTGLRGSMYKALGRMIKGIGNSTDEIVARDIWKQARQSIAGEKSLFVQASACWCVEQLFLQTPYFDNTSDYEKLQTAIWRALDSPSSAVRQAAATCLSSVLVKSYSATTETPSSWMKKPRLSRRKPVDGDGEIEVVKGSPMASPNSASFTQGLSFNLTDILGQLSYQYCRANISNRSRAGIALCYIKTCKGLGNAVVDHQYGVIARHFLDDILGSPNISMYRYRLLVTRKLIRIILGDVVGRQQLGETGQVSAAKFLINSILKDYPEPTSGRLAPSKHTLAATLDCLTALIECLGSTTASVSELCRDGILQVLEHRSYTVQVQASKCLQTLVLACPQQILPTITICMNSVNRHLGQLSGARRSPRRCLAFALGLSSTIRASSSQPLYGSNELYSRVLIQATDLLKSSGNSDLRISSTQIQVAWILISGLMSLGPSFVKLHLSQFLLLWRNALPKSLGSENIGNRGPLELSFLTHVRECALGCIRTFLTFNARLLTMDVFSRLSLMLQNTVGFLNSLPSKKVTEEAEKLLSPHLHLQDYDMMVRRRVFECYMQLANLSSQANRDLLLQSDVLSMAVSAFANPEVQSASSIASSIASSSGAYDSIWDIGDNCGFGLNGLVNGLNISTKAGQGGYSQNHWMSKTGPEAEINRIISTPICSAAEHDALLLYASNPLEASSLSDPPATEVVNAAILVFAMFLPLQSPKVQGGALEQVCALISSNEQQKNSIRESAVKINVTLALLFALQHTIKESSSVPGDLRSAGVEKTIQELLHMMLTFPDQSLRHLAAEALGRLCRSSGPEFASKEVSRLIDMIVENREPNVRSGCAVALGCIHSELGGMAAGLHLKTILGLLTSLASDPHPTVHFWALDSISKVADAAGLTFSSYVPSTLGMLAQLYVLETHNDETGPLGSSNLEFDFGSPVVIARCVDSIVNVLGPDLQDVTKTRNMIMTLTHQLQGEPSPLISVSTLQCVEHLSLYAPGYVSLTPYIRRLQGSMSSEDVDIQSMAIQGLNHAIRRNAELVFSSAGPDLEDQLWSTLNYVYGRGALRDLIKGWVQQTALLNTESWIKRCHRILTKQVDPQKVEAKAHPPAKPDEEPNLQDEEIAGFATTAGGSKEESNATPESTSEFLRWQVRSVAMDCLNDILLLVADEKDLQDDSPAASALQPMVADLIKIAFTASTASVVELRIQGIQVIRQVLQIFGKTPDPDFLEVPLLDQYQAQISSALTPAFAADSSPVLAAESVGVCATFIATGIVTNVDRMGRILKLLISALGGFSRDAESTAIGDLKGLSSNAQVMVRLAIFSAWAELQIASVEQKYLVDVVTPHLAKLIPLWLNSLKEYAHLKFEPDISATAASGTLSSGLDMVYAALSRETSLKFYQDTWLNFVNAILSLIDGDSNFVFDALEEKHQSQQPNGIATNGGDINYRNEPAAFFFVLFGITFEALVSSSTSQSTVNQGRMLQILQAIKNILRPSTAGLAIYQDIVFSETVDLLDRLVLTEGLEVQIVIVETARNLCIEHPSASRKPETDRGDSLSDDVEQLFELTKIIVLVIARLVPTLSENSPYAHRQLTDEMVPLIISSLSALADAAEVFPSIIKGDLHACIMHIFATILATGSCQDAVVPQALPIFRRFIISIVAKIMDSDVSNEQEQREPSAQLRAALTRFLRILKHSQKRESEASLPCEKNTLLASTILLSAGAKVLPPADPLVERFLDEIVDCLGNRMTSKVAANCARTLLLLPSPGPTESAIAARLFPRLVDFICNPSEVEGTDATRPIITQALVSLAAGLPPKPRSTALSVLVPAILQRAIVEGNIVHVESSARLLELAKVDQGAFRAVFSQMNHQQRAHAETVLRAGGTGENSKGDRAAGREDKEPSIALRVDFGP